ncbi:MAG: apolipoprotein N-acyltransferase [Fimbriimonadaceae bacterium]|nr:apolipoprotein N-acyltransferase [Fimbriimonadaceae bacterium]
MNRTQRIIATLASGGLVALAFPPFGFLGALPIALVPWLWVMLTLDPKSIRAGWAAGYGFGFAFGAVQMFWTMPFVTKWTGSAAIGVVPWLIGMGMMALWFGLLGVAMQAARRRDWVWSWPILWAGLEVARSYAPAIAYPWGLLATPLAATPDLARGAYFLSIFGMSAALVGINLAIAQAFSGAKPKQWALALVMPGLAILGYIVRPLFMPPTQPVRVALIQPAEDLAFGDPKTEPKRLWDKFNLLLPTLPRPSADLVLMPEGITHARTMPPVPPFPVGNAGHVMFGGQRGDVPRYQSSFFFDGQRWQYRDKTRLVIFGEYVPFRNLLPASLNLPSGDLIESREPIRPYEMDPPTGPLLCFEALFPDIAWQQASSGARLLAVMSIDDWFLGTNAMEQLRMASIWRAIETGLPVARVGSMGYTMAIRRDGVVVDQAPLGTPAVVPVELSTPTAPAAFPLFPAFPVIALAAWIGGLILAGVTRAEARSEGGRTKRKSPSKRRANKSS